MKRICLPLLATAMVACQDLGPIEPDADLSQVDFQHAAGHQVTVAGFDADRGGTFSIISGSRIEQARADITTHPGVQLPLVPLGADFTDIATDVVVLFSRKFDEAGAGQQAPLSEPLSAAEQTVLKNFVTNGGCAILVADFDPLSGSTTPSDWAIANNSLVDAFDAAAFDMNISGMTAGWVNAQVDDPSISPITQSTRGIVHLVNQLSPGLLTDVPSPAVSLATARDNGSVRLEGMSALAVIPPGTLLGPSSGPVIVHTNALSFADEDDTSSPPRGAFGANRTLWLNTIDYCMEWDDGSGENTAPTADAGGPYNDIVNTPVTFDGSGSDDSDGDPLTFEWDFDDGNTATGEMAIHTFDSPRTYIVTLTVTDPHGASNTSSTTATITTPPAETPEEMVDELVLSVRAALPPGKYADELVGILDKAREKIVDGKNNADDKLNDFIERVEKFEKKGLFDEDGEAAALINAAQAIIDVLNN